MNGSLSRFCALRGAVAFALIVLVLPGCVTLSRSSLSSASLGSAISSLNSSSAMWAGAFLPFQEDIRLLTLAAVEAGAGGEELLRQIGRVAEQHGVTDWEAEPLAYRAMGEGLSLGGLDAKQARTFAREIAGDDADALRALVEGYEA